jgi:hypothetical protein
MAMRPVFRWLLAAVCMCMAVVLSTEGLRLSLGDTPVMLHCRSGKVLCELGVSMLGMFPTAVQGLVLGASTCAAAALMGLVTWMVLKARLN